MADDKAAIANDRSPEIMDGDLIRGKEDLEDTGKTYWQKLWPAMACGAGLFSDGYLQSVIGPVNTCLSKTYPIIYGSSNYSQNITSIAFAGTVLGQLVFGYTADAYSRKWSLVISTIILFVFAALAAGSYGANGSIRGLLDALTAYRFLLGIGIGYVTRMLCLSEYFLIGIQRRVSGGICGLCRVHWRAKGWYT